MPDSWRFRRAVQDMAKRIENALRGPQEAHERLFKPREGIFPILGPQM